MYVNKIDKFSIGRIYRTRKRQTREPGCFVTDSDRNFAHNIANTLCVKIIVERFKCRKTHDFGTNMRTQMTTLKMYLFDEGVLDARGDCCW